MSKTIKSPKGVTVRFIEAINGFKTRYGYWPTRLEAAAATIAAVATENLTPLGFFLMQSKIDLVVGQDGCLVAKGRGEDIFDYGRDGWQSEGRHEHDARAWLGLDADD